MKLSDIGEFGLIKKLQKKCAINSSNVITGIGDDAAVVTCTSKKILITSDMLTEGVHFDRAFTTFAQLGHKFLAVNISDILAMGGTPENFLINLAIPGNCTAGDIYALYSGIMKTAGKFGVSVVGGDTCSSECGLVLSGTLLGSAKRVITRSGAKAGDSIFLTNTVGDSAMGLYLLKKRGGKVHTFTPSSPRLRLINKHLMPQPSPLKNTAKVTSMIDVSDGLLADLSHLCDESKAGALLYKENIPLSGELHAAAKNAGLDPYTFAFKGGEDYSLLFTAPPDYKTDAYRIGEMTAQKGRYIIDRKGRKTIFQADGYDHFKKTGLSRQSPRKS